MNNHISPKKSLGQNFLIDNNIIRKIIEQLNLENGDIVIEIGPGTGALTSLLVEKKIELTVIELDIRAIELLKEKFKDKKINIINNDIRKVNLNDFYKDKKIKIIGNLPYYISADILFLLFKNYQIIDTIVIMVQKEVAKRIISPKDLKEYGILSVVADFVFNSKIAFDVSANCFFPKPKVTSSIVKFEQKEPLINEIEFDKIVKLVKTAFNQRRKTLRNSLKSYLLNYNEDLVNSFELLFKSVLDKRAENLSSLDYLQIYKYLNQ